MKRILFVLLGVMSVVAGVIGIFVPGLPTTPFLLLASWLFVHSSPKLYEWLLHSKILGSYLRRYQRKQGVSRKVKLVSIVCMFTMISISAFCFFDTWRWRILLFLLGGVGLICVLFIVPSEHKDD